MAGKVMKVLQEFSVESGRSEQKGIKALAAPKRYGTTPKERLQEGRK
jgi:hypothetical protein